MVVMGLDYAIGDVVDYKVDGMRSSVPAEVLEFKDGKVKVRPEGARARWAMPKAILRLNTPKEEIKPAEARVIEPGPDTEPPNNNPEVTEGAPMLPAKVEPAELEVQDVAAQVRKVQELMESVMTEGSHYGVIPGCGDKPTLLKPGAEKLSLTFRLVPEFECDLTEIPHEIWGHREYHVTCKLIHQPTGKFAGEGVGMCSTMEAKYRYRTAERTCPQCGKASVIKGKADYGGGWLCWKKKNGCGAKWGDRAPEAKAFEQAAERQENPDPADTHNTVMKMSKKRAHVAIITALSVSDMFTQDIEDMAHGQDRAPEPQPPRRGSGGPGDDYGDVPDEPRPPGPGYGDPEADYGESEHGYPDVPEEHRREDVRRPPQPPERTARVEGYLSQAAACKDMGELASLAAEVANVGLTNEEKGQIRGPWSQIKNQLAEAGAP